MTPRKHFRYLPLLFTLSISAPAWAAEEYAYDTPKTFNAVNTACLGLFDSVRNPRTLAANEEYLTQVRECIFYGVDPPINTRPRAGTAPANSISRKRISGTKCAPFETCLAKKSTVNKGDPRDLLYMNNESFTSGGTSTSNIRSSFNSPYNAPQFNTETPNELLPSHLKNGGSVKFYGEGDLRLPNDSLVNPNNATNFYSENGRASFSRDSTVYVPPTVNGQVAQQNPIIVMQDTVLQFNDGGLIHLPADFDGVIGGRRVTGGQWIYIAHNGKLQVPSGTGIYPMPSGSTSMNPDMDYTGPSPSLPGNVALRVNDRNQPGTSRWW